MIFSASMRRPRDGMTLVELLMVVAILAILLAVSVPLVRPAFRDRQLREAARQINAFFAGAQARAADVGRPVGVWIERFDNNELGARHSTRLYMAEVGPAFTGTTLGARVRVGVSSVNPPRGTLQFSELSDAAVLATIVAPGEQFSIKFDYKGYDYPGLRAGDDYVIEIPWGIPPGGDTPLGLPYEITRGPIRSAVAPLVLPGDSVIDLSVSGSGRAGTEFDTSLIPPWNTDPIIIMFAPTGRVDQVYSGRTALRPNSPMHLLVGRKARVVNPHTTPVINPELANLADPANLWVTISHRTGAVTTANNDDTSRLAAAVSLSERVRVARELARASAQKGGR